MGWRDKLQQGSFRGVSFYTSYSSEEFGRRVAVHEIPLSENWFSEDMGKKPTKFTIDGFVIGDNYIAQRDALITASNIAGSGILKHPYFLGSKKVFCESFSVSESAEEGRVARFTFTFTEAGTELSQTALNNVQGNLISNHEILKTSAFNSFNSKLRLGPTPNFLNTTIRLSEVGTTIKSALLNTRPKTIDFFSTYPTKNFTKSALFWKYLNNMIVLPDTSTATIISSQILNLFSLLNQSQKNPRLIYKSISKINLSTYTDNPIDSNNKALQDYVKILTLSEEAKAISNITFESVEEAQEIRSDFTSRVNEVLDLETDYDVYNSLQEVKKEIISISPTKNQDLPYTKFIETQDTLPTLNIVFDVYENLDKESDFINRNNVGHPGFVKPQLLKVLV